jgi:hypothetical protein
MLYFWPVSRKSAPRPAMYAAEMLVLSSNESPKTMQSIGKTCQSAFFTITRSSSCVQSCSGWMSRSPGNGELYAFSTWSTWSTWCFSSTSMVIDGVHCEKPLRWYFPDVFLGATPIKVEIFSSFVLPQHSVGSSLYALLRDKCTFDMIQRVSLPT